MSKFTQTTGSWSDGPLYHDDYAPTAHHAIAWLRPDPRRQLIPVWLFGVCLLLVGSGLCALFFSSQGINPQNISEDQNPLHLFLGLFCVLCGMLTMVVSALRVLSDERCLTLMDSGITYTNRAGLITHVDWTNVLQVKHSPTSDSILEFDREDAGPFLIHLENMSISPSLLRDLLEEERKRVLMEIPSQLSQRLVELKIPVGRPLPLDPKEKLKPKERLKS